MGRIKKSDKLLLREHIISLDEYGLIIKFSLKENGLLEYLSNFYKSRNESEHYLALLGRYDYFEIEFDSDYDSSRVEFAIYGLRYESDDEVKKRLETSRKMSVAAKAAAETKRLKAEQEELELYKKLKEKYDGKEESSKTGKEQK